MNQLINSQDELLYELALIFNHEMYKSSYISFNLYKSTETNIIKKINKK